MDTLTFTLRRPVITSHFSENHVRHEIISRFVLDRRVAGIEADDPATVNGLFLLATCDQGEIAAPQLAAFDVGGAMFRAYNEAAARAEEYLEIAERLTEDAAARGSDASIFPPPMSEWEPPADEAASAAPQSPVAAEPAPAPVMEV